MIDDGGGGPVDPLRLRLGRSIGVGALVRLVLLDVRQRSDGVATILVVMARFVLLRCWILMADFWLRNNEISQHGIDPPRGQEVCVPQIFVRAEKSRYVDL